MGKVIEMESYENIPDYTGLGNTASIEIREGCNWYGHAYASCVGMIYDDGTVKQINIFAQFPKEESNSIAVDTRNYQLSTSELTVKGDGLFDNILPIVIAAAIFFAADWILYAHEQY